MATDDTKTIINSIRDALFAVEKELGAKPSSIYGNVKSRLDVLESRLNKISSTNVFTLSGSGLSGVDFYCYLTNTSNGLSLEDNASYLITFNILIMNTAGSISKAFFKKSVLASQASGTITFTSNSDLSLDGGTGWTCSVENVSQELVVKINSAVVDRIAIVECDILKLARV